MKLTNYASFQFQFLSITLLLSGFFVAVLFRASALTAQSIPFPSYQECEDTYGGKLEFCHATSSEDNPYVRIEVACEALYGKNGNAGHLDENGTPLAGHEDDVMLVDGLCPGEEPEESPTPSPSESPATTPSPSETASPSPTETTSPSPATNSSPSPTTTSSPSPNPTDEPEGNRSALGYDIKCENDQFKVTMDLTRNGNPEKDVDVRFEYLGSTQDRKTNDGGRAEASYAKQSGGTLKASANNFPSQQIEVVLPQNCPDASPTPTATPTDEGNGTGGGSILGVSTDPSVQGKVLGASTLANTSGFMANSLSLGLQFVGSFSGIALLAYAEKK